MEGRRVIVEHAGYGCDTGCCGHVIRVEMGESETEDFRFDHPYHADPNDEDALKEWARELVEETLGAGHAADLDWENCQVLNGMGC